MIQSYFDDSGTHSHSRLVVLGGLMGTPTQWEKFEGEWGAKLATPIPGKPSLRKFHLAECNAGQGPFIDYTAAEQDAVKRELAKDASSFANASGGRILIGVRTRASSAHFGDEIEEIRPFPQSLINITQYQAVLDSWIYPQVDGLEVKWIATKVDATKGVVVIKDVGGVRVFDKELIAKK